MRIFIIFIALLGNLKLSAQSPQTTHHQTLSIGDIFPEMVLHHVLNRVDGTLDFRNLNDKSLIIDFGGTKCPPCLESLLRMDTLQVEYKDKITMVMANNQNKKDWEELFNRNPIYSNVKIPIITEDTILHNLFDHAFIPHIVWIGKDRKIKAITGHSYFNEWAIQQFLTKEVLDWPTKLDINFDPSQPLITFNRAALDSRVSSGPKTTTYVSGYLSGLISGQKSFIDSAHQEKRYIGLNMPLLNIYRLLLNRRGEKDNYFQINQIVLGKGINSSMIFSRYSDSIPYDKWHELYSISYEISVPLHFAEEKSASLIWESVSDYLNLDAVWGPRKRQVLVLTDMKRVATNRNIIEPERISELLGRTQQTENGVYIIDESKYTSREKFMMRIPKVRLSTDINQVKNDLLNAGIDCHIEDRLINTLVLTKKEN